MLVCCAKRLSCVHHEGFSGCEVAFEISSVALWCSHTSLHIRLNCLLLELKGLFAELEKGQLIRLILILQAHQVKVLDFTLDGSHTDHIVWLMVLLLELDRVVSCDSSSARLHLSG